MIARTNVVYYMEKGEMIDKNQNIDVVDKGKAEELREEDARTEELRFEKLREEDVKAEELRSEDRNFAEVLEQVGREQLIRKAKELLDADVYQEIHKESAIALEKTSEVPE